jgi:GTP-binding protein YchF
MLQVGIVGLPNVGKSTVFNALSQGGAKVSNFPFCTVEPNRAVVPVPDPRLDRLAAIFDQQQLVPAAIAFVDVAGLVRGASRGEGLGNQFLGHLREVDALLHVVRCFVDERIAHVEGSVDPARDAATVDLELALADLATVARRAEKAAAAAKAHDRDALRQAPALQALRDHLDAGGQARTLSLGEHVADLLAELHLLTAKPVCFIANVGEDPSPESEAWVAALSAYAEQQGSPVLRLSARLEAELGELPPDERGDFVEALGVDASGLERVVRASYQMLDLVTFFTGVGKELRAWAVAAGTPARVAAGRIHSDMAQGFVRAEVIGYEALIEAGSWAAAHDRGLLRTEGKDYPIAEGDVVYFRFHA